MFVCVPAGGLGQDAGELALAVDAVVLVVIRAGDVEAAGLTVLRVLLYFYSANTQTHQIHV